MALRPDTCIFTQQDLGSVKHNLPARRQLRDRNIEDCLPNSPSDGASVPRCLGARVLTQYDSEFPVANYGSC